MILEILQATPPTDFSMLLNYGPLGVFAVMAAIAIKYLIQYINKQNDVNIKNYKDQVEILSDDKRKILKERDDLIDKFFKHLSENEGKLISIIADNSKAFNKVSESNENVATTISLLVTSINDRNNGTQELNDSIQEIIKNKK